MKNCTAALAGAMLVGAGSGTAFAEDPMLKGAGLMPRSADANAAQVWVFGRKDIEAGQFLLLSDLLRESSAAFVADNGPFAGGLVARQLQPQVHIDGVRVLSSFAPPSPDHFVLTGVRRVEFYPGANSFQSNTGLLPGHVHLFLRNGRTAPGLDFSAEGGGYGTMILRSSGGFHRGRLALSFGGTAVRSDNISASEEFNPPNGIRTNTIAVS